MIGTTVVYLGLLVSGAAIVLLFRVLPSLGRRGALLLLAGGFTLAAVGALLPVRESRTTRSDRIDAFLPRWHFHEVHETTVQAPPARVMQAIHAVSAREIRFFRGLMAIRGLGLRRRDPAAEGQPLLGVALRGGFLVLAEDPESELVIGTAGRFWQMSGTRVPVPGPEEFLTFDQPGCAKVAMNFRLEDAGQGRTRVTTETRILGLDAEARRKFGAYWRVIYPGSAVIRRSWLVAIKARAESQ
jgi:hypothetical protein